MVFAPSKRGLLMTDLMCAAKQLQSRAQTAARAHKGKSVIACGSSAESTSSLLAEIAACVNLGLCRTALNAVRRVSSLNGLKLQHGSLLALEHLHGTALAGKPGSERPIADSGHSAAQRGLSYTSPAAACPVF